MSGQVHPSLVVADVSVRYGDVLALDGVDLEVGAGEVVAILGPSGSGKSTLLRAIAGLEPIATGRLLADGVDLAGLPTHERGLGLMFQDHALFPHETVAGNIAFGLRMAGVDRDTQRARIRELLAMVGLTGFESRSVSQLSGGEAQRVALARSLAPAPALLMLDEPLGSLDRVLREQLTDDLRLLLGTVGVSALHVTHDQSEAFAVADRVVIMRDGKVVQSGEPEELWHRPATRFVAEFLGHPNVWDFGGEVVLAPLTSLAVDPEGDLDVVVVDAVFVDGRFRVTAMADDRQVVFEARHRPQLGETVRLQVDGSLIRTLERGSSGN
ncbi:MAG: ABC transporter ATP-binding protein [Acidimicrobiales bacterium]